MSPMVAVRLDTVSMLATVSDSDPMKYNGICRTVL